MFTETEERPPIAFARLGVEQPYAPVESPGFAETWRFVRGHWRMMTAVSALLLVPCFWHRYIVAGDLDSHLYNAWLVQLIERGQAPGLWIARQWNNVLFDFMLSSLGNLFGLQAAERIAVSVSVLVFFWGAFSLVSAAARRAPWFLVPCLGVLAYGWTFMMGFFNYYLSLGLSFFALALWWRGRGNERIFALALAPLIWVAHPFGLIWFVGAAAYVTLARILPTRTHIFLLVLSAAGLAALGRYLSLHFSEAWTPIPGLAANGSDQVFLYGPRYLLPARFLLGFVIACLLADALTRPRGKNAWKEYALSLQLYVVVILGVSLLPGAVRLPQFAAPVMHLTQRFSSLAAVLACCLLGIMRPRKWHLVGFAALAALYFSLLYQDTAVLVRLEGQAERLTSPLPFGSRVTSAIWTSSDLPLLSNHIVDRACIGRCFSWGNYEPSSGQFRVRASPGNPIVASNPNVSMAMQTGSYVVRREDLPLYQIYLCERNTANLCLRELPVGAIH
jgi:hypothetical protein